MSVRIANQIQMMFTIDGTITYEAVEAALVDAGFENYDISRQVYSTTTDVVVTLSPAIDPMTQTSVPFDAADSLSALADAVAAFVTP